MRISDVSPIGQRSSIWGLPSLGSSDSLFRIFEWSLNCSHTSLEMVAWHRLTNAHAQFRFTFFYSKPSLRLTNLPKLLPRTHFCSAIFYGCFTFGTRAGESSQNLDRRQKWSAVRICSSPKLPSLVVLRKVPGTQASVSVRYTGTFLVPVTNQRAESFINGYCLT